MSTAAPSIPTPVSLLERLRRPPDEAREAWTTFVHLYTPLLFAWTRRLRLADADAQDLVQDVMLRLLTCFSSYTPREGDHFRGWLWRVFINRFAETRRRPGLPREDATLDGVAAADNVAAWVEEEYHRHLIHGTLRRLEGEFSTRDLRAFRLSVFEEKKPGEIARELGVSANVVYLARCRILARLRQELDGMFD